jgi:hypothetical protein
LIREKKTHRRDLVVPYSQTKKQKKQEREERNDYCIFVAFVLTFFPTFVLTHTHTYIYIHTRREAERGEEEERNERSKEEEESPSPPLLSLPALLPPCPQRNQAHTYRHLHHARIAAPRSTYSTLEKLVKPTLAHL